MLRPISRFGGLGRSTSRAVVCVVTLVVFSNAASVVGSGDELPDLHGLLARMDGVARVFEETALRFECKETIRWNGGPAKGHGKLTFAYIFVRDRTGTQDYRTWTGRSGTSNPTEVDPSAQGVPRFLRRAFQWIQIFQAPRWPNHRYSLVGRGTALGRPAIGIRFEPIPPMIEGINTWYGTAWVDPESAQILSVEAYREEQWAREQRREALLARSGQPRENTSTTLAIEQVVTEFGYEREGIRLPSSVRICDTEHRISRRRKGTRDRERVLLEVEQAYTAYRFFATDAVPVDPGAPPIIR